MLFNLITAKSKLEKTTCYAICFFFEHSVSANKNAFLIFSTETNETNLQHSTSSCHLQKY